MFKIYYNPQAKRALLSYCVFQFIVVIILIIGVSLYEHQFNALLQQQATEFYAVSKSNFSIEQYFQGATLPESVQLYANELNAIQFFPKQISSHFPNTLPLVFFVWVTFFLIGLLLMTWHFYRIYQRIETVQHHAIHFFENPSELLNIQSNEHGVISALENDLFHLSKSLHTMLYDHQSQKQFLAKNLADISHQLKTPLTALLVVNDTLLSLPIDQRSDEQLLKLKPQLNRIEQLVHQLLILTRIDASVLPIKREHVPINQLCEAVIEELKILAEDKFIHLQYEPVEMVIAIDAFYFKEALLNIVKNAIEHTPINGTVIISVSENIFVNTITIFNNGPHISNKDLPHIFQRFYRGENASPNSVGIGLSLAFEIVKQHNGQLSAENVTDGVVFSIDLQK